MQVNELARMSEQEVSEYRKQLNGIKVGTAHNPAPAVVHHKHDCIVNCSLIFGWSASVNTASVVKHTHVCWHKVTSVYHASHLATLAGQEQCSARMQHSVMYGQPMVMQG